MGALFKIRRPFADLRTYAGSIMTIAGERAETTWLRVADVAALMGVSANTVRRWTDAGRIAAHRSPGGHRRYRAADPRSRRAAL